MVYSNLFVVTTIKKLQNKHNYYDILQLSTCLKPEIVEEKEVDLIISDIMMPVKIGITLCKEIKENININFSHIPFIMLTAKGGLENQKEHYARNYFVDNRKLAANQQDNKYIVTTCGKQ